MSRVWIVLALLVAGHASPASAHALIAAQSMPGDGWIAYKIHVSNVALIEATLHVDAGESQPSDGAIWIRTTDGSALDLAGFPVSDGSGTTLAGYSDPGRNLRAHAHTSPSGTVVDNDRPNGAGDAIDVEWGLAPLKPGDYFIIYAATSQRGRSWSGSLSATDGVSVVAAASGRTTFHKRESDFPGTADVHARPSLGGVNLFLVLDGSVARDIGGSLFGEFFAYGKGCEASVSGPRTDMRRFDRRLETSSLAVFNAWPAGTYTFTVARCIGEGDEIRLWGADVMLP